MRTARDHRILLPAAALALLVGCRGDLSADPPIHFNPNMDNQERFDPQEPNPFFKDGLAMRKPVPGTARYRPLPTDLHLHQGWDGDPADLHLWEGRTGEAFASTLPARMRLDEALLARGRERFTIYCAPCHGPLGRGDGVVFRRQVGLPKPADFHEQRIRAMPLGQIVHTLTKGKQNMPRMGFLIPAPDRWAIAVWVRTLQLSQGAPTVAPRKVQP